MVDFSTKRDFSPIFSISYGFGISSPISEYNYRFWGPNLRGIFFCYNTKKMHISMTFLYLVVDKTEPTYYSLLRHHDHFIHYGASY